MSKMAAKLKSRGLWSRDLKPHQWLHHFSERLWLQALVHDWLNFLVLKLKEEGFISAIEGTVSQSGKQRMLHILMDYLIVQLGFHPLRQQ